MFSVVCVPTRGIFEATTHGRLITLISLYGKNVIKSGTSGTVRGFVLLGPFALRYFVLRATSRLH